MKKLFENSFFRGSLLFTMASFGANIFSYIFNLIVARAVPVVDYGEYTSSLSYFFILSVPMTALSMIVIKKVGSVPLDKRKEYARTLEHWLFSTITRNAIQLISGFVVFGVVLWRFSNLHVASVLFVLLMASSGVIMMFYQSVLQANKWFFLSGIFVTAGALIKLIGGVGLWFFSPDLLGIYLAVLSSVFITLIVTAVLFRKSSAGLSIRQIHPKITSYLSRKDIYIPVITMIGVTALINLDVMIVKKFFTAEEAGLYGGISLLGRVILYISSPIAVVAYTFFTGHESENQSKYVLILSSLGLFLMSVISCLAYYFLPTLVVGVIFGSKYEAIYSVIWLSAFFGSLYGFVNLYVQYLLAKLNPLSMLALPVAVIQFFVLLFYHESFSQVLYINIFCSALLIVIYLYSILKPHTIRT